MTGVKHPVPRANGTADRFCHVGVRIVFPAGGFAVRGQGCQRIGSGVPAAAPSIILSQIGEARLGAGVIRSQPVLSPLGSGFSICRFRALLAAARGRYASGGAGVRRSPADQQTRWTARAGTDQPFASCEHRLFGGTEDPSPQDRARPDAGRLCARRSSGLWRGSTAGRHRRAALARQQRRCPLTGDGNVEISERHLRDRRTGHARAVSGCC